MQSACECYKIGSQVKRGVVASAELIDNMSITFSAPDRYSRAIPTKEDDREACRWRLKEARSIGTYLGTGCGEVFGKRVDLG
jgi:hypothetical protein